MSVKVVKPSQKQKNKQTLTIYGKVSLDILIKNLDIDSLTQIAYKINKQLKKDNAIKVD